MSLPVTVASPLTRKDAAATLIKRMKTAPIQKAYLDQFGYEAAGCFEGLDEIGLYQCRDTALMFYAPASIAGPESLYRCLEQFPWCYEEVKWEHGVALVLVSEGDKVLDVGCGRGAFLARASAVTGVSTKGIEFNQSAAEFARARSLDVCEEPIETHAAGNRAQYDVITSFQVLEHLVDPASFIAGCLEALRPGGQLILGVPNNEGFLRYDERAILNGPPHHMALWTRRSLEALEDIFPLRVRRVETEPLRETDWYRSVMEQRYLGGRVARSLYYRLGFDKIIRTYVEENASNIDGHTIVAVYEKY